MTKEDYKVLEAAWTARKWPAHLTLEQIVEIWKFQQEQKKEKGL